MIHKRGQSYHTGYYNANKIRRFMLSAILFLSAIIVIVVV